MLQLLQLLLAAPWAPPLPPLSPGVPLPPRETTTVIGLAKGKRKYAALLAALRGRMINGVITDEATARYLLSA